MGCNFSKCDIAISSSRNVIAGIESVANDSQEWFCLPAKRSITWGALDCRADAPRPVRRHRRRIDSLAALKGWRVLHILYGRLVTKSSARFSLLVAIVGARGDFAVQDASPALRHLAG